MIRKFQEEDFKETAKLIRDTFTEFNRDEANNEGFQRYIEYYNSDLDFTKSICFVAIEDDEIVGVVRGKDNRIMNTFVKGKFHNRGIGKELISKIEEEMKKNRVKVIKIRSSLYAVKFYEKLGYSKKGDIEDFHGIKIQPMEKFLV